MKQLLSLLQISLGPGLPIPPQIQTRYGADKILHSYDGERAVVKHVWDNIWLDVFFGLVVLFFALWTWIGMAIGETMYIVSLAILTVLLIIVGFLAYRESRK